MERPLSTPNLQRPPSNTTPTRLDRALRVVADVRAGESPTALLLALNVFLILTAHYVLKSAIARALLGVTTIQSILRGGHESDPNLRASTTRPTKSRGPLWHHEGQTRSRPPNHVMRSLGTGTTCACALRERRP